jgi:hypothetical protein
MSSPSTFGDICSGVCVCVCVCVCVHERAKEVVP